MADSHSRSTSTRFFMDQVDLWHAVDEIQSRVEDFLAATGAEVQVDVSVTTVAGSRMSYADTRSAQVGLRREGDSARWVLARTRRVVRTPRADHGRTGDGPLSIELDATFAESKLETKMLRAKVEGADRILVEGTLAAMERYIVNYGMSLEDRAQSVEPPTARRHRGGSIPDRRAEPSRRGLLHNPWVVGLGVTVIGGLIVSGVLAIIGASV